MTEPTRVKVRRDGPRGWHWIALENFDATKHELVDAVEPQPNETDTEPKKRGRPRKQSPEN